MTLRRASSCTPFLLIAALSLALHACGDDDEGGGTPKGGACQEHQDCREANARCRKNICTGALGADAFEVECDTGQSEHCAGLACLGFKPNKQQKTGICTMPCASTDECGPGAACADVGVSQKLCVSVCSDNSDCSNGFVCVTQPGGTDKACLVEPQ